jgi:DNA-binding protein YbaB
LQNALKDEKVAFEKHGIKVVINGKLEVEEIKLNPDLAIADQEKKLTDCLNDAMKKVQMIVAQKMQSMGGLGF